MVMGSGERRVTVVQTPGFTARNGHTAPPHVPLSQHHKTACTFNVRLLTVLGHKAAQLLHVLFSNGLVRIAEDEFIHGCLAPAANIVLFKAQVHLFFQALKGSLGAPIEPLTRPFGTKRT